MTHLQFPRKLYSELAAGYNGEVPELHHAVRRTRREALAVGAY